MLFLSWLINTYRARILLGLILSTVVCFGVTVTERMVTKSVNAGGGCVVPTPATTFLTTDQSFWVWFNVSDTKAGDVASAATFFPSGAAHVSATWDPLPSGGSRCFWWPVNIAGSPPASSPGNWSVRVGWNGSPLFNLNFTIAVSGPTISPGGILNAASYAVGAPVAPGSIVAVYGSFPQVPSTVAPAAPWPVDLGGLSMRFAGGVQAPLYYASGSQANLLVPWELSSQTQTSLVATVNGQSSAPQTVGLSTYAPGIFSMNGQGTGLGAILDTTYRLVDTSNPATPGSTYLQIYCTGLGPVTNQPASGAVSPSNPLAKTLTTPTVTIGGIQAQVIFSGLAPGFVGEYQVNALVPAVTAPGDAVPVVMSIGEKASNTVTIAVKGGTTAPPPVLSSVLPNTGNAGQILTAVLLSSNTGFLQGPTLANFGPGISVGGAPQGQPGPVTVVNSTSATASLTIDPAAVPGPRMVIVSTGLQTASLTNAFLVQAAPAPMPPLAVVSTLPANRSTGVSLTPTVQIQFNVPLDPATVGRSTFGLAKGETALPITVAYDPAKYLVSLTPDGFLSPETAYTVIVGALLRNAAGNPLNEPYSLSFTTVAPLAVTGTITPTPGLDPRTLTVLSFGGKTSRPDSNGSFTAALHPTGTTLVAAVVPGKKFALLAALTNGGNPVKPSAVVPSAAGSAPAFLPSFSPQAHSTRWQITAAPEAAASQAPVLNYQTTAETLVFLSPYLYTTDPLKQILTQTTIASSLSTKQLANVLQAKMTGANPPISPMKDPAVKLAAEGAVQEVLPLTLPQFTIPTTANSTPPTILSSVCDASQAAKSFPPATAVTPYCKQDSASASGGLACLDLDYLSFCGKVQADQDRQSFTFSPLNCTDRRFGCAVGWLARVTPIDPASDGGNAEGIGFAGSDLTAPSSPVGPNPVKYDDADCGRSAKCYAAWIPGNSIFGYLDLGGIFGDWVSGIFSRASGISAPDYGSFVLPASTAGQDYMVRFYSGGSADYREVTNVTSYSDGASLATKALGINMAETALNYADSLMSLAGAGSAGNVAQCALSGLTDAAVQAAATESTGTVSSGVKGIAGLGSSLLTNAISCGASEAGAALLEFGAEALIATTGVGAVVEAAMNVSAAAGNAAQAVQRSYELAHKASLVETAVIRIMPASAPANNPVPKITSLSPSSVTMGASAASVTIKGNSFMKSSTVLANNAMRNFKYVDSGTLVFDLTTADLSQARTFSVEVRNPTPGGGTSKTIFTVAGGTASNPAPEITSLYPSSAALGANALVLSILGRNFLSNSSVTFAGSSHPVTTPSDSGLLTIQLISADLARTGAFPVVVTNPGLGGGSSTFNFTILDAKPSQPAVTGVATSQRTYVAGDQFVMKYTVLAGAAPGNFDLMVTFLSRASGDTYYYYDDATDTNSRWLHSTMRAASTGVPRSGEYSIPSGATVAFDITDKAPSGEYHIRAYFSRIGANQPVGALAETDFSVATSTEAGECFVATAAFGSSLRPQVRTLRLFRDNFLLPRSVGRAFVNWYYRWSPSAAGWLREHAFVRKLVRAVLCIPIAFAWLSLRTNVALALLSFTALLFLLIAGLRRGPAWCRGLFLFGLVIGIVLV